MKTRIFLPALFIFALGLSACQAIEDEPPAVTQEEKQMEKKMGTVEADDTLGGYVLVNESGKVKVRSLAVDLRKYEHRRIEAEGAMGSDDVFTIESATQLSRDDETKANVKDTTLGISVEYPNVWVATAKENSYVFTPYKATDAELVDKITVARFENSDKKSLESYLDLNANLKPNDTSDLSTYTSVVVGLDQLSGIKKTSDDGVRIDFYVTREAWVYRLSHSAVDTENREKNRNIFFDIVNSFKFVALSGESSTVVETQVEPVTPPAPEPAVTPTPEPPTPILTPEPTPEPESTPSSSSDLGDAYSWMNSRGFGVKMQYPKNWFWEQVGTEIRFSDKPLDESGTIVMRFYQGRPGPEEAGGTIECSEFQGNTFCLASETQTSGLMKQMLGTLGTYTL